MLDYIFGFIISILSGLGIGGGGLLVIYLVLISGVGQLESQGINLVYFLFSSGASMIVHLMKRKLNPKLIFYLVFFGIIGAVIGSFLAKNTDPAIVRRCFGGLLLISGTIALVK